jgi:hypothetical protein
MNSKLIFAASDKMKYKVHWPKVTTETEWIYFGVDTEINKDIVSKSVIAHFSDSPVYIAVTRKTSFETDMLNVLNSIESILVVSNFIIWDKNFSKAIEFNKIGVLR